MDAAAEAVGRQLLVDAAPFVTTSHVLIEVGDGLSRIHQRPPALAAYDGLRGSSRVEIVHATEELETRAWEQFRQRLDKEWSVTDCVSFTLMNDRGIKDAFTTDHHFEQAGLIRLIT